MIDGEGGYQKGAKRYSRNKGYKQQAAKARKQTAKSKYQGVGRLSK
jgi:hypothetical protein